MKEELFRQDVIINSGDSLMCNTRKQSYVLTSLFKFQTLQQQPKNKINILSNLKCYKINVKTN